MDELVGHAAEQRAHAPEPARADDDLVRVAHARHVGDRPGRRRADQLALPADLREAGVGRLGRLQNGVRVLQRAVDVRLEHAPAAPGLGHVPGVDEVQLAARADAADGARQGDVRRR